MKNYRETFIDSCENCQTVKPHQDGGLDCRSTPELDPVSCYGICDEYIPIGRWSCVGQINVDYSHRQNEEAIIYPNR